MKRILWCAVLGLVGVWTIGSLNADEPKKADRDDKAPAVDKNKADKDKEEAAAGKNVSDEQFLKKASAGQLSEINLGRMAARMGGSDAVRQFGQRMVTDHGRANDELIRLANRKGWSLANEMDKNAKDLMDKLSRLDGADFDRTYMDAMIKDHKEDASELETASKNCKDADLKDWAGKTLPIVRDHLKMAQDIDQKLGGKGEKIGKPEKGDKTEKKQEKP